jgi:hypothetical protein
MQERTGTTIVEIQLPHGYADPGAMPGEAARAAEMADAAVQGIPGARVLGVHVLHGPYVGVADGAPFAEPDQESGTWYWPGDMPTGWRTHPDYAYETYVRLMLHGTAAQLRAARQAVEDCAAHLPGNQHGVVQAQRPAGQVHCRITLTQRPDGPGVQALRQRLLLAGSTDPDVWCEWDEVCPLLPEGGVYVLDTTLPTLTAAWAVAKDITDVLGIQARFDAAA